MENKKVLLVDDEEKLLSALKRRFEGELNIETNAKPEDALDVIERDGDIAVIVADMQMPNMNGIELLRAVKEVRPDVCRLMLTGNADQETAIAAINEGEVMRFLRKPCSSDNLRTAIVQALDEYAFRQAESCPAPQLASSDEGRVSRDTFLSLVGDELRTPSVNIIGLSRMLEHGDIPKDHPEFDQYVAKIGDCGEVLLSHVNRIMEYSRLSAKSGDESGSGTFELSRALSVEVGRMRMRAKEKGVTISFEIPVSLIDIPGNEHEIRLAFHELLSNAVRFADRDGYVSVNIRLEEQHATIRVFNSGAEISEEFSASSFEPFHQESEGFARDRKGMGLGLPIVRAISQLHGGYFEIGSEKGRGTTALLTLFHDGTVEQENLLAAKLRAAGL